MTHLVRPRNAAFTLVEMVIVLVVLGVLAALAVPTFQSLVTNGRDRSVELSLVAVHKEAATLAVLDGRVTFSQDDVRAALRDVPGFTVPAGWSAAALEVVDATVATGVGELTYAIGADGATLAMAAVSPSGNTVFLRGDYAGSTVWTTSDCVADAQAAAASSVTTGCPSDGLAPALAPTGLTITEFTAEEVALAWSAPVDLGGASLLGYVVESSGDGTSWSTAATVSGQTATVSGELCGPVRHFRVAAVTSTGTGTASDPVSGSCPAAGTFTLASSGIDGTGPDGVNATYLSSHGNSVSSSGRWVLWHTREALDAVDTNGAFDLYMTDMVTGTITLISRSSTGGASDATGTGGSYHGSFSPDERWIYFSSSATNLTAVATTPGVDLAYAYDRDSDGDGVFDEVGGTQMVLLALTDGGMVPDGSVDAPSASSDGRYVAVRAGATDLAAGVSDMNGVKDVYILDRDSDGDGVFDEPGARSWSRVDPTPTSGSPADVSSPKLFPDASKVAFSTAAALVAADANETADAYLVDLSTGARTLVSARHDTGAAVGAVQWVQVSNSGGYVSYDTSAAGVVASDTNAVRDVFLYRVATGTSSIVTASGNATSNYARVVETPGEVTVVYRSQDTAIAPDGADVAGTWDAFIWTSGDGGATGVAERVSTTPSGKETLGTAVSDDGRTLAVQTSNAYDASDLNEVRDIYVYTRP